MGWDKSQYSVFDLLKNSYSWVGTNPNTVFTLEGPVSNFNREFPKPNFPRWKRMESIKHTIV